LSVEEKHHVDTSERRVIGSLLLLSGITFLVVGFHSGQLNIVLEIVREIFEAAVAGAP